MTRLRMLALDALLALCAVYPLTVWAGWVPLDRARFFADFLVGSLIAVLAFEVRALRRGGDA